MEKMQNIIDDSQSQPAKIGGDFQIEQEEAS
jgi:hypothetical protein